MKYLFLLSGGLLLAGLAHAQFGLRAGSNLLHLASDSLSTSSRVGYHVGLFYQVHLTERWSLVPEVQFSQESRLTWTDELESDLELVRNYAARQTSRHPNLVQWGAEQGKRVAYTGGATYYYEN